MGTRLKAAVMASVQTFNRAGEVVDVGATPWPMWQGLSRSSAEADRLDGIDDLYRSPAHSHLLDVVRARMRQA